jgi:hypothetical protein
MSSELEPRLALTELVREWAKKMRRLEESRDYASDHSESNTAMYYTGIIQGLEACAHELRERIERIDRTKKDAAAAQPQSSTVKPIRVLLSEAQAWTFALFLKRVGWSEISDCAIDDAEAREMVSAIRLVQDALTAHGYAPR